MKLTGHTKIDKNGQSKMTPCTEHEVSRSAPGCGCFLFRHYTIINLKFSTELFYRNFTILQQNFTKAAQLRQFAGIWLHSVHILI